MLPISGHHLKFGDGFEYLEWEISFIIKNF